MFQTSLLLILNKNRKEKGKFEKAGVGGQQNKHMKNIQSNKIDFGE